jgi:hypothetical protein
VKGRPTSLPAVAVVVLALSCASASCGGEGTPSDRGREAPELAAALPCAGIAESLRGAGLPDVVRARLGPWLDAERPPEGADETACGVHAEGPLAGLGAPLPLEALEATLAGSGWVRDPRFDADGPGTSSFRVARGEWDCSVSGGAHAWIEDDEVRQDSTYRVDVACLRETPGDRP